jgi:hypothetical protein
MSIRFLTEATDFLFPRRPNWLWAPPRALYPGVNSPEREANHSPPSSVEVKNSGALPPLPHGWHVATEDLIHREIPGGRDSFEIFLAP